MMFARSTSITGDPAKIDACITYLRDEVMPEVTSMNGCMGLSMLVNRDSGLCIATTSWLSEAEMMATEREVSPMRSRAEEILGGSATVDKWEIAVMHREHDAMEGSWCRTTWLQCPPADMDATIDFYKDNVLTKMEESDTFCSASMLVDRATGRCCGTARFESREGLDATRDMASALRAQRSDMGGVEFTGIEECELVIAHLRVPELV